MRQITFKHILGRAVFDAVANLMEENKRVICAFPVKSNRLANTKSKMVSAASEKLYVKCLNMNYFRLYELLYLSINYLLILYILLCTKDAYICLIFQ